MDIAEIGKRIVFSRSDGGVSVVVPAAGNRRVAAVVVAGRGDGERLPFEPAVPYSHVAGRLRRLRAAGLSVRVEWAEDEAAFLSRIAALAVPPEASGVETVEAGALPGDRSFRDAWVRDMTDDPAPVRVDMPRARAIQLRRIRRARDRALAALDVDYQRADESGDAVEKRRVAARKQALRDLPETLDLEAAETPEQLEAAWPALLG